MTMTAETCAVKVVLHELARATDQFGPMHSMHEGYAVLREEIDELWDEVKANQSPAGVPQTPGGQYPKHEREGYRYGYR